MIPTVVGRTSDHDSDEAAAYIRRFAEHYESMGYTGVRPDAVMVTEWKYDFGGKQ